MFNSKSGQKKKLFTQADREAIRWFWDGYFKKRTPILIFVFGLIALQGLVYQQFLSLTEDGLRIVFESGSLRELAVVCATVFGVFVFRGVISFLVPRISTQVASTAVEEMRNNMIEHYLKLDLAFFDRSSSGDMMLRLFTQAQALSGFIGQSSVKALRDFATIIVVSGYLLYKQPLLFTSTIAILPVILFSLQFASHRVKKIQLSAENAFGAYMNGIEEMANGMRTIKIASQEEMEKTRMSSATSGITDLMVRLQTAQALVLPLQDLAAAIAYVLVIGGGGYMVLSPDFEIDGAGVIAFLLGLVLIFDPARRLSTFFVTLQANLIVLGYVRSLFLEEPTVFDKPGATDKFDQNGDIVLDSVTFGYHADQPLFRLLDMVIKGGSVTAIVGPTGSGKTSILSLLGRLYEPSEGSITIGGQPISDLKVRALRKAFSVVAQDIVVFNKSIFENVKYVRPEASDEEVWAAAEAAEIDGLMKERGNTPVGPKGAQLSGGQKQRIAIARCFLQDAPIVILDEATSALDQQTEDRVKRALTRLSKGRTTIIVAHRLSSVTDADCIYVLDSGHIVESGSHSQLMKNDGLYAKLFLSQKSGYATEVPTA
ncbi:MAG: ABC transporter ATP-binding protein [Pseudomonadota bacterium]